jgi:malonyl-CoA O-methyltransferase
MLQWSHDKKQVLSEIWRTLKPGGKVILSSLITPSLHELHQAFMNIDNKPHTLEFLTKNKYIRLFNHLGFNIIKLYNWKDTIYFSNLFMLLRHFKITGTNLPKSASNYGLGGKLQLQRLANAYQQLMQPKGLPITYSYLLIVASKGSILS